MKKKFFLTAVAVMSLGVLAGCGGNGGGTSSTSQGGESQGGSQAEEALNIGQIKVWVDEKIQKLTGEQIDKFKAAHPTYNLTYKIEPRSESSAAGDVIQDPQAAADIYIFAQDQLTRLVTAKAIAKVPGVYKDQVVSAHDAGAISGATAANELYAYPVTRDNTFVMYYDKSVFPNTDMTDFNAIVARAKEAGKKVYYEVKSAWYNAAFFYGAGAHSEWEANDKGKFIDYDDTYNSAAGQIAVNGMHELFSDSTVHVNKSDSDAFDSGAAVLISGTWAKGDVTKALGNNFGVTTLPKYTVNGTKYSLTPFGGSKLLGVLPQTVTDRSKGLAQLALFLTNEECQLDRFTGNGWGPSNKAAMNNDAVKADVLLQAVYSQMGNSVPQGQYPGGWWDHAGLIGTEAVKAGTINPATILKNYQDGLNDFLK